MLTYFFLLAGGYLGLALLLRWHEPSMIYYPSRTLEQTPSEAALAYEELWLTTSDNQRIHGWYLPVTNTFAPTILFLHGNAGNISHRLEKLAIFQQLGAATLIIDYRGYGLSSGTPSENGTYRDAQAAYDWLARRGVVPVVYGESLGSAVAVELAVQNRVTGVILEEAFTSIGDVGQKMFPFLPVRWLVKNKYDSLSKISRLRAPLLLLHSPEDEIFNPTHAQRLLAAAPSPRELVQLRGSHNDAFLMSLPVYRAALARFLESQVSSRP